MERELRPGNSDDGDKVEIDIRKILEQMGLDRERWPQEWRGESERKMKISP